MDFFQEILANIVCTFKCDNTYKLYFCILEEQNAYSIIRPR